MSTSLLLVKSFSLLAINLAVEGNLSIEDIVFLNPEEGDGVVVEDEAPEDDEAIVSAGSNYK